MRTWGKSWSSDAACAIDAAAQTRTTAIADDRCMPSRVETAGQHRDTETQSLCIDRLLQREDAAMASRRQQFPQEDPRAEFVTTNAAGAVTPLNDSRPRGGIAAVPGDVNAAAARQGEGVAGTPARFVVSLAGHVTLPTTGPPRA